MIAAINKGCLLPTFLPEEVGMVEVNIKQFVPASFLLLYVTKSTRTVVGGTFSCLPHMHTCCLLTLHRYRTCDENFKAPATPPVSRKL